MCGGFALHLARGKDPRRAISHACLFLLGKAFTYAFIGALVGALGLYVVQSGWVPGARKALVYVAAIVTILLGILMLELPIKLKLPAVRWPGASLLEEHCPSLLRSSSSVSAFVLGLAVGYLPCPLTALLAVAAAGEHSVLTGMAMLGGAGIDTMPGLLAVGIFSRVSPRWPRSSLTTATSRSLSRAFASVIPSVSAAFPVRTRREVIDEDHPHSQVRHVRRRHDSAPNGRWN